MYAHGATQSVSRAQVLSRPKAFYEKLLADVSNHKNPYQAYFVEYLWWYIFHEKEPLCPSDLPVSNATAPNRRQLFHTASTDSPPTTTDQWPTTYEGPTGYSSASVLEPYAGDRLTFGSVVRISWA